MSAASTEAASRFAPGQRVRIIDREHRGHMRTPHYCCGRLARVVARHGTFPNPESLAYHGDGLPAQPLYMVAVAQRDLWPDYQGAPNDELLVDIYEHWLEPAGNSK